MIDGHAQLLFPKLASTFWLAESPMQTPSGAGQPQEAETKVKGQLWGCSGAEVGVLLCLPCVCACFVDGVSLCWEHLPYRRDGRWLKLESGACWESACLS